MPYIKEPIRKEYNPHIDQINRTFKELNFHPGDLVYVMFRLVKFWWHCNPCFDTINQIRGVLSSTLTEFDRVVAAPYEDKKIDQNGDIE